MLVKKVYAEGGNGPGAGSRGGKVSENERYTRAAINQAQRAGLSPQRANSLVRNNAARNTRPTPRANYVNRLGI